MIYILVYVLLFLLFVKVALKLFYNITIYDGPECLTGKVAIVTGGNRGIGIEITKYLASRGCKVIIACRSKAENERKRLIKLTHNENVFVKEVDLTSFESVRNFAKEINRTEDKIDILINNAGTVYDVGLTVDGLDPVMQANAFSSFLLTHMLVESLKKSKDGRIVFSSSVMAFFNNVTLDNLNNHYLLEKVASLKEIGSRYGNSKLLQALMSQILSEKLRKYGIKSNAVHPGLVDTTLHYSSKLNKSMSVFDIIVQKLYYLIIFCVSKTSREGVADIIRLVVSDKHKETTGQFYWGCGMLSVYPKPRILKDIRLCQRIWQKLEEIVKLKPEELLQ